MRPRRPDLLRAASAALVVLALAAGRAAGQESFPTELQTIARVRFEGRHAVPARELRAVMKTKPPSPLPWRTPPRLRRDFLRADTLAIETLYHQHGYLDARAHALVTTASRDARRATVSFRIEEGRRSRIRAVTFTGNPAYSSEALGRALYARPGRTFNPSYLAADTLRIADAYQERGYLARAGATAHRESLAVDVRYDVHEGPLFRVGRVGVVRAVVAHADSVRRPAIPPVDEALARRELLLREGDLFKKSRVEISLERLYDTGLFSQAQFSALPDTDRAVIDFDLRLADRKPRWLDAGVGSGTSESFRFTGEWGHRNLAGQGLNGVLGSRLALDGKGRFLSTRSTASLVEPWLFGWRTRGGVSLYYERTNDRADPRWVVDQEAKGITLVAYRGIGRRGRVQITQDNRFVLQQLRDLTTSIPDSTLDSLLGTVKPSYATHRLALEVLRDRRDDPLIAHSGSLQDITAEIAGGPLQGASSFGKGVAGSSWYTPLGGGRVLATRARGGVIRPFGGDERFTPEVGLDPEVARVPLEDRFRLGGVNSVRGFDENAIAASGGLAMVNASAELRVPVAGPFGLELFVDAGNVWAQPRYMRWDRFAPYVGDRVADDGDLRYVFGAGGTLMLPFGPLRVDLTWSPRPIRRDANGAPVWFVCEPQFAIGPSF